MKISASSRTALAVLAISAINPLATVPALAEVALHRGNGSEPQTLDQAHATIDAEWNILGDLYEGLTVHDSAGALLPGVAESWAISDDGLVYTFKLRAEARWSNGDPVTADDFVFSFKRIENPTVAAEYANILYPIKNAEAINIKDGDLDSLGVTAIDATTLEITLARPTPYFLELLAEPTALPFHRASIEKFGSDFVKPGNMISNGAFVLSENVTNDRVTLTRNSYYSGAPGVKLDTVIFYPTDDQAVAVRRFQAGELDLNQTFPTEELSALQDMLGKDQVRISPGLSIDYYAFDERQPPFDDIRVRQALSMAIDRDLLADGVLLGAELPLYSFVPPGIQGYRPAVADFAGMSQRDREVKAKDLLNEAGYDDGGKPLKVEITFNDSTSHRKVAAAVAGMWKAIGAEVTLANSDTKSYYAHLKEGGPFGAARIGWQADYADPENFLALCTSTNTIFNYSHYDNPHYDELMANSYKERDPVARYNMLHDAETLLMQEQGVAPLTVSANPWLVSRKVKGWQDNSTNSHLSRYMSIE